MRKNWSLTVITILTVMILAGCGTTTKETSDNNTSEDKVVIAAITPAMDSSQIQLINNAEPETDYIICTGRDVAVPDSLIEVFRGYPYTDANFVCSTTASGQGAFAVEIGNSDSIDNYVFYVTSTASGMRRSEAVILSK